MLMRRRYRTRSDVAAKMDDIDRLFRIFLLNQIQLSHLLCLMLVDDKVMIFLPIVFDGLSPVAVVDRFFPAKMRFYGFQWIFGVFGAS